MIYYIYIVCDLISCHSEGHESSMSLWPPFGSAFMFARAFRFCSHKALDVSPLLEGRLPRASQGDRDT